MKILIDKTKKTSIFYVNSMGFMAQWVGEILEATETSVTIKFSKNKAYKFDLTNCQFCLITNSKIKDLGVSLLTNSEAVCFDDDLIKEVLTKTKGNVYKIWQKN
jgi:hypothetical protein